MMRDFVSIAVITLLLGGVLAGVHYLTSDRIAENREAERWRLAREMTGLPTLSAEWQNDALALADGRILERRSVRGYGGNIQLLALRRDGQLLDLRVTRHNETPGIGDFISRADDPWMVALTSDAEPIDTVTGATVTSRAMLRAAGATP